MKLLLTIRKMLVEKITVAFSPVLLKQLKRAHHIIAMTGGSTRNILPYARGCNFYFRAV